VAGGLLGPMIGAGSLFVIGAWLSFALLIMGFVYGPLGAWLPALFPARVRYTGASMGFNVGGVIGGGLTPSIAQALSIDYGLWSVGVVLAGAGVASLIGLVLVPRDRQVSTGAN